MIKFIRVAFFLLFSMYSGAQVGYEKAYFIKNTDKKIECLIKNKDWLNNPIKFDYKITENGDVKTETIESVKEFGFENSYRYLRTQVNIDRSSDEFDKLSSQKSPIYKQETLFLKELINAKASLYSYIDKNITRYFYKLKDSNITQLVYKAYTKEDKLGYNRQYQQQLFLYLKCPGIKMKLESVGYKKRDLLSYFEKYNNCSDSNFVNHSKNEKEKKDLYRFTLRPGIRNSSYSFVIGNQTRDLGTTLSYRIGLENEFFFNFNKNKWSAVIEPMFQSVVLEKEFIDRTSYRRTYTRKAKLSYTTLELPVSIRHSINFSNKSRIFINAGVVFAFPLNNSELVYPNLEVEEVRTTNFLYGIGYNYSKFSFELRGETSRSVLKFIPSSYNNISFILGYRFF